MGALCVDNHSLIVVDQGDSFRGQRTLAECNQGSSVVSQNETGSLAIASRMLLYYRQACCTTTL
jgi:hypothetical protein